MKQKHTGGGERRPKKFLWGFTFERFVRDIAYQHGSDYHSEKELHEVFDQIGAPIIKLGPNRFIVIDKDEVLIYKEPEK
jgi:hypothetical protein